MPGVKARYPTTKGGLDVRKINVQWFNEFEQNCNTCKNLTRVPHAKRLDGLLLGRCSAKNKASTGYSEYAGVIKFHPDDSMHMPCYEPRQK